jgi:hypothetical protein
MAKLVASSSSVRVWWWVVTAPTVRRRRRTVKQVGVFLSDWERIRQRRQDPVIARARAPIELALIEFPAGGVDHECLSDARDALLEVLGERRLRALA